MDQLDAVAAGFQTITTTEAIRREAMRHLRDWLTKPDFADYLPQLRWLIEQRKWAGLLDRFYQILPFGTGGRRGAVGIGPNRMNAWTLTASVQGHCEYLKEKFPGVTPLSVVVAYDVRQFEDQRKQYNSDLPNPVLHLSSKTLAHLAAGVYAANGIHVHLLSPESTHYLATPELSFTIRMLQARGGLNLSASHNPPDDNGGKFYDERGGQPVPPDDQIMANLVDQVTTIKSLPWNDAVRSGKVHFLEDGPHKAYLNECLKQSLVPPPKTDDFKVVFTPLHGVGSLTAMRVLQLQGFRVIPVEEQMTPDGQFTNVTKSPNPEVPESMDRAAALARETRADLVLATDPDADRLGAMAPDRDGVWHVITGNQLAALVTHFKLRKLSQLGRLPASPIVVRTQVTTSLVTRIARHFNAQIVDDLLVGFKYVADLLARLESEGAYGDVMGGPDDFVIASEESHGLLLTPQIRDKDAGAAALVVAEIALDQKRRGKSVMDYLDDLYQQFGYFCNAGESIFMRGIEGKQQMAQMLDSLRTNPLHEISGQKVTYFEDLRDTSGKRGPILGDTDAASRNVLLFRCGDTIRVAFRPSGTEPKAKAYVEVSSELRSSRTSDEQWREIRANVDATLKAVIDDFLSQALARIGLDRQSI